jgi:hypothetical protein
MSWACSAGCGDGVASLSALANKDSFASTESATVSSRYCTQERPLRAPTEGVGAEFIGDAVCARRISGGVPPPSSQAPTEHLELFEAAPCVLIKGPAGVGKSVSVLYGLKLLLEKGRVVVLETQPTITAYLFRPGPQGYEVSGVHRIPFCTVSERGQHRAERPRCCVPRRPRSSGHHPGATAVQGAHGAGLVARRAALQGGYKNAGQGGLTCYVSAWKDA